MVLTTFDSTKESLEDLLQDANCGKIQLPNFQRGWVWDDYGIRSLLVSRPVCIFSKSPVEKFHFGR